ncbi:cytochrome C assembly family protein [Ferrimonas sp.]|uniref:cytochrome C assembly family protein n=1 Tax=Ferrimonas sp. TaxID=2080861 RepID=UPI003A8DFE88
MEFFAISAIIGYGLAFYLVASKLLHPQGPNRKLAAMAGAVGVLCHGAALIPQILENGAQHYSLVNTASMVMLMITTAITLMLTRIKVIVVVPAVYICGIFGAAGMVLLPQNEGYLFNDPALFTHVGTSLLAYSVFLIAALYAIQLASINRRLKDRKLMLESPLPPLMTVEKQLYHFVMIGFVLLSLSLLTGFIFLEGFFGSGQAHKAIFAIAAWLVYGIMLLRHRTQGIRIRSAIIYSMSGVTLLTLAYFGNRLVRELFIG